MKASEAAVLKQIEAELKKQDTEFEELPKLRQLIELSQQYQGDELRAKRRELDFNQWKKNGYALDAEGRLIGLCLSAAQGSG